MGADPERTFSGPEQEYVKQTYDVMLGTFSDYAEMIIQVRPPEEHDETRAPCPAKNNRGIWNRERCPAPHCSWWCLTRRARVELCLYEGGVSHHARCLDISGILRRLSPVTRVNPRFPAAPPNSLKNQVRVRDAVRGGIPVVLLHGPDEQLHRDPSRCVEALPGEASAFWGVSIARGLPCSRKAEP